MSGEFEVIARLVERLPSGDGVLLGPGDDCAVLATPGSSVLATADLLVEGRHFDLAFSSPADVGFKAIAVNVSDIAAMGGTPRYALVSIGAAAGSDASLLERVYDGIAEASRLYGVVIAGGDLVVTEALTISVAMIGEPPETGPVTRAGARAGDVLCVTGEVGAAAAGLWLLRAADEPEARVLLERFPSLVEAHRRGRARVDAGRAAAASRARAMIDVSDGLAQDAGHIAAASGVGLEIDAAAVPVAAGVAEVAAWLGEEPWIAALRGGDDYELAIAIAPEDVAALREGLEPLPVAVIGRFTDEPGVRALRLADGSTAALPRGWDHLAEQ